MEAPADKRNIIEAALFYFLGTFAFGFVFGTIRVLFLAPSIGETAAVLFELPFMLIFSWHLAGFLLARHNIPPMPLARLAMGGLAFVMLMVAEAFLATNFFGQTLGQFFANMANLPGFLGLAGQLGFGLIPWARR